MIAVNINENGVGRVLNGVPGMTFVVDNFTGTVDWRGEMAHVRDYRYPSAGRPFQIWSIPPDGYEIIG